MKLRNKVNQNSPYGSKPSNVTIIIANTKYTVNSVPITQVKAGNNILQYKAIGNFSYEERLLLNDSLKQAYIYINETHRTLQKPSTHTIERLETILGDMEDEGLQTLISTIKQIQDKVLNDKLVVLKENYLDTEKDHILASVKEDDTFTFTVYENFFDKKEFKDNRAGVIIHELCHLCDIEEGADMYDLESAECLKNIILCLCEKLTLKQIRQEYARKQVPQERDDGVLTFRPNGSRDPDGRYNDQKDGGNNSTSGTKNTNNTQSFNLLENLYGKNSSYNNKESTIGNKLNLNLPSFEHFDPIKSQNIDNRRIVYMEARKEKVPEKSLGDKLYDGVKDSSLVLLNLAGKVYSTARLVAVPIAPISLKNPDFLKTSTFFAWNNGGTFYFDEKSQWTKDLKNHKHFINKKNEVISKLANNAIKEGKSVPVSLSYGKGADSWTTAKQFGSDLVNIATLGVLGTPNSYTTGSINGNCTVEKINHKEKSAILRFDLDDHFGMESATRNPKTRESLIDDNPKLSTGKIMMKNLYLNWTWREKVSF